MRLRVTYTSILLLIASTRAPARITDIKQEFDSLFTRWARVLTAAKLQVLPNLYAPHRPTPRQQRSRMLS